MRSPKLIDPLANIDLLVSLMIQPHAVPYGKPLSFAGQKV